MIPAQIRPPAISLPADLTSRVVIALLFSSALTIGCFAWQGSYGFNIGDESFLWYGVQRIQAGEVPILDFAAYDPGRYYWSAALMRLFHSDGIIALRLAGAVFQFLGLFVGLMLLVRQGPRFDVATLAMAAITLLTWMFSWYKVYDTSVSIVLIAVLSLLIQQPSQRRFFLAGVSIGLAAVFGRNHGVYGVAAVLLIAVYLACRQRSTKGLPGGLLYCACGVGVGYLPVIVMMIAVPGFATAFLHGVQSMFERGTTNLPLPVPWPWLVPVSQLPRMIAAAGVLTGALFIAVLVFAVLSVLWIVRQTLRKEPVDPRFVAASVLTLPYTHYAFSRADLVHLALGIFPFLIGVFLILAELPRRIRWLLAATVMSASLLPTLPDHPGWDCRVIESCVSMEVGGDRLQVEPLIAGFITMLQNVTEQYAPNGQNFLVTPLWPGAYALFKRKSPMWDIYALFPQKDDLEKQEIERIKAAKPGFVLILDIAVDERDDLRFPNTHPLIERYVRDNFDPVTVDKWPAPTFQFYKAR